MAMIPWLCRMRGLKTIKSFDYTAWGTNICSPSSWLHLSLVRISVLVYGMWVGKVSAGISCWEEWAFFFFCDKLCWVCEAWECEAWESEAWEDVSHWPRDIECSYLRLGCHPSLPKHMPSFECYFNRRQGKGYATSEAPKLWQLFSKIESQNGPQTVATSLL